MTALSNIVPVTISRQTAAVSRSTFGVPAIIAQFATSKTTATFGRTRYYGSMSELAADGWASGDAVYDAASKVFGQKQKPARLMVGRWDSGDASLTAALDAIQLDSADWYAFGVVGITSGKFEFSADLITGNSVTLSIDGTSVGPVAYTSSHATTMAAIETAIESAISGAVATVSGRAITVTKVGRDLSPVTVTVAGGTSRPTTTITYITDSTYTLAAASWAAANGNKLFGHADADPTILTGAVGSLPGQLKALSYDRTFSIYHAKPEEYAQFAWIGEELAGISKLPGKSTWAEKVLQGVTADTITEGQYTAAIGLNCSVFVPMGGVNVTLLGVLANGEPIETIRGIDYAVSEIQADLWALKVNNDKIPYNDAGIALEENTLRGTVSRMETAGVFVPGESVITAPKFADVPAADIAARLLNLGFTAKIQNAIVKTDVQGVVTL